MENKPLKNHTYTTFPFSKPLYFIGFCLLMILTNYITKEFLTTEEMYHATLGEQLSYDSIEKMLALQEKWQWVGYAAIPLRASYCSISFSGNWLILFSNFPDC